MSKRKPELHELIDEARELLLQLALDSAFILADEDCDKDEANDVCFALVDWYDEHKETFPEKDQ